MSSIVRYALFLLLLFAVVAPVPADEDRGKFHWSVRLRYEDVDTDGFDKNARATTGRFVLGYETRAWHDFTALLEFEGVEALDSDTYNSTANGVGDRPAVADPEDTEINRAYLAYHGVPETTVKFGRQRIVLDNARFIGNVGWRQNEQTYDAFSIDSRPLERLSVFGARINNVNRIFGESHPDPARADTDVTAELLNAGWQFKPGKLTGYGYWLEFDDNRPASNRTVGLRFKGATPCKCGVKFTYTAEWADQEPHAGGADTNEAEYFLAEAGIAKGEWSGGIALEQLGGDGTYAFQTPLATLHAFNGWADLFLSTPADGLQDRHANVGWKKGKMSARLVYHDYVSDEGSDDYGDEWGLLYAHKFSKRLQAGAKFSSYGADTFGMDTDKIWVWLSMKGGGGV